MRFRWITLIVVVLVLVVPRAAAREVVQGDDCEIGAAETITGDVFVLCRRFVLNGTIEGNLIGATFDAELNGAVAGDVYLIAGQLETHSQIGRDLLYAGPLLRLHPGTVFGDTGGDLMSLSLSSEILPEVEIPGSITSLGYQLLIAGDVGREVQFWGSSLQIGGHVTGDVDAAVGDPQSAVAGHLQTLLVPFRFDAQLFAPGLVIEEPGQIDGQLRYTAVDEGRIDGQLAQPALFDRLITTPDFSQLNLDEESNAVSLTNYLALVIREFITLGAIGLLALLLIPRLLQAPLPHLAARPVLSLAAGLLGFILSIALWIIILILLILALLLFLGLHLPDLTLAAVMAIVVLNIGGAGVFYFVAVYLARLVACLMIGRVIIRLVLGDDGTARMMYFNLLAGVALLAILAFLPLIGGAVNLLALVLGLGGIFMQLTQQQFQQLPRRLPPPNQRPAVPDTLRQIPPPMIEPELRGPGMDNLPRGFRWWSDDKD